MVALAPQTYVTHRRMDPWYHYVGTGLILAAFVIALVQVFREPGLASAWMVIASAGLVVAFGRIRVYALRNQDRLIRLEETLRMERILAEPLRSRIPELSVDQLVALRFAPDAELPSLVEQTLAGNLDRESIKKLIKDWRADTFRV